MIWIGTSGYNYPEWKGRFYPETLPAPRMLSYYAGVLSTVEINYSFYRLPTPKTIQGWADATPPHFRFSLKAPRRITHDARLSNCEEVTTRFCETATALGPKLAGLLFQLPPFFRKDLDLLSRFLDTLPSGTVAAFEFRHPSWLADDVYEVLRARDVALCVADSERLSTPFVETARHGYLRLRDEGYEDDDLQRWAARVAAASRWTDAYVYFKHEAAGKGPEFARRFTAALTEGASRASDAPRVAGPEADDSTPAG